MAQMNCDVCGGKVVSSTKEGWFYCENCGTEYPLDWMKAKFQKTQTVVLEGPIQIEGAVKVEGIADAESLIKRAYLALEDRDWEKADDYFERALVLEPESALAYIGKLLAELQLCKEEELMNSEVSFSNYNSFQKAIRFADEFHRTNLEKYNQICQVRLQKRSQLRILATKSKNKIAAGSKYSVGIKTNGTVVAVGYQDFNNSELSAWKDIISVAVGGHIVGLKKDGRVVVTGSNGWNQCDVANWNNITAIAAGHVHTAGLRVDGTVVAISRKNMPQCDVANWRDIISIAAGDNHTVGLRKNGTVIAVGENDFLQCETSEWRNIIAVAAGRCHTVGLKSDGTVIFCGGHVVKIEKNGSSTRSIVPATSNCGQYSFNNWKNIVSVSAGPTHTIGLKEDGTVVAFGTNKYGECNVSEWKDIIAIAAGDFHSIGMRKDGTVVATGDNVDGQCDISAWRDIGLSPEELLSPEEIAERKAREQERNTQHTNELLGNKSLNQFQMCISAGFTHAVAVCKDGTVAIAGENEHGQIDRKVIEKLFDVVAVSAGGGHTAILRTDGTVVSIGCNKEGECKTQNWSEITSVSAGGSHTVGLKKDGTVVAVGCNEEGQCNTQDWRNIVAVSAGGCHTSGLKSDGTVLTIGENKDGRCNTQDWRNIVAISAGGDFTVGLKSDGTIITVGSNDHGKRNTQDWRDIVAISAGYDHLAAVKSDGTVVSIGKNEFGQCNTKNWKDIVAVSSGNDYTIGLNSSGKAIAVGKDAILFPAVYTINTRWTNIGPVSESSILEVKKRRDQSEVWKRQGLCEYCGGQLGGLFTKKCKSCGK